MVKNNKRHGSNRRNDSSKYLTFLSRVLTVLGKQCCEVITGIDMDWYWDTINGDSSCGTGEFAIRENKIKSMDQIKVTGQDFLKN